MITDMTRNISSTQCRAYNEHFVTSANEMRKGKKGRIKEDALALIASNELPPDMGRAFQRNRAHPETSLVFSIVPSDLLGTTIEAPVFYDSVAVHYNYPTPYAANETCSGDGCNQVATIHHACSCMLGGNIKRRHDDVLRTAQKVAQTVTGDTNNSRQTVVWRPVIQSRQEAEAINAQLPPDHPPNSRAKALEGDLAMKHITPLGSGIIMIDGRCTHPEGPTAEGKTTATLLKNAEEEKQREM